MTISRLMPSTGGCILVLGYAVHLPSMDERLKGYLQKLARSKETSKNALLTISGLIPIPGRGKKKSVPYGQQPKKK